MTESQLTWILTKYTREELLVGITGVFNYALWNRKLDELEDKYFHPLSTEDMLHNLAIDYENRDRNYKPKRLIGIGMYNLLKKHVEKNYNEKS